MREYESEVCAMQLSDYIAMGYIAAGLGTLGVSWLRLKLRNRALLRRLDRLVHGR